MSHEVCLSSEAERCIEEQLAWYDEDEPHGGTELADRWIDQLERVLDGLSEHLERYRLASENGRWRPNFEIRQMRFKPWKSLSVWKILFVVDETANRLTVLQIRHESRPFLEPKDGDSPVD